MNRSLRGFLLGSTVMIVSPALAQTTADPASASATTPSIDPTPVQAEPAAQPGPAIDPLTGSTQTTTSLAPVDADIVVTGSRIRRPDGYNTIEPIQVLSAGEITQQGFSSPANALQSVSVTQGTSQINNYYGGYVTDGGVGANTLGLRGLGPARTLILLNGHRLSPAGSRGSVGSVDLNVLPTALIDRIEILKAGASSIYGSDAVAGVVNIITNRSLKGVVLEGQVNVPEIGRGTETRLSASFGHSGDRLTVIGSAEYYKRRQVAIGDVSFTDCPIGGLLSGRGTAFGSGDPIDPATGQPKCHTIDNGGVTINTLGVPGRPAVGRTSGELGTFARLSPNSAIMIGTPGYEGVGTYDRDSYDPEMDKDDLVTPAEIYTGYLQASYKTDLLGDAEIYAEVLGNRRKSSSLGYRQLTLDYTQGSPLLPEIFRDGAFVGPNVTSNGRNVAARAFIGYGQLDAKQRVDFVRVAGGVRGSLPFKDWRYDLYFSKAYSNAKYGQNTFLTDRLARSLDAVANADGSFSCADTSDGACVAAPALSAAVLGGDLPQAYRDYITENVVGTTKFREFIANVNLNGSLFKLPGGDLQLALGAEYRKSRINDTPPIDSINGNLYNLTSAAITRGSDSVWEVYGEALAPILKDVPFFYRLNLDASIRYTDYKSYGSNETYKIAGEWQLTRGFGFRASYGTSYRAPALFEQFLGATSGFLSGASDPCDSGGVRTPIILRNCAAIGLPADFVQTGGVTVYSGGGATSGLKAETSKNFSGGFVFRPVLPERIGSFAFSVDYFDIKVKNGVARAGAGAILNLCYADPSFSPTAGYCRLVTRNNDNSLTVDDNYLNLSTDVRRGVEFNGRFSHPIGPGNFVLDGQATKYFDQSSRLFPTDPEIDANGTITVPDWTASFDASYALRKFVVHYGIDWINGDNKRSYYFAATDSTTGQPVQADYEFYRDNYYWQVKDYYLHNMSVQYGFDKFTLTAGVRNLFDRKPPRISTGYTDVIGNAPLYSGYDVVGRQFFVNASAKF